MPAAATPPTTTGWPPHGVDVKRQDRARAVLGALQLPRIQGADRRAAGRSRSPHLLRSRGRWVQEGQGLSRRTVGTRKPHPARRHRLRLPRAGRSAHARVGVGARREAHRTPRRRSRCPKIISAPLSWRGRARPPRGDAGARRAAGLAGRPADRVSRRAGTSPSSACACRSTTRSGPIWTVTGRITGAIVARRAGHRRQPSRRVGVRRRRSVERHRVADGAGAVARRAREAGRAAERGRSCSRAGTPRSSRSPRRPNGASSTRAICASTRSRISTSTARRPATDSRRRPCPRSIVSIAAKPHATSST